VGPLERHYRGLTTKAVSAMSTKKQTGRRHSEATKRKISESLRGHAVSAKTRKKLSRAATGRKHSPETIRKFVASRAGYTHTEETKRAIGLANSQRKRTKAELEEATQHLHEYRRNATLEQERTRAKAIQDHWESLSSSERKKKIQDSSGVSAKNYRALPVVERKALASRRAKASQKALIKRATTDKGTRIRVHSGWEASVYNALEQLGVRFTYANDKGSDLLLDLGKRTWTPDFRIHGKGGLLIEVKGRFIREFYRDILKPFKKSKHADKYSILLIELDVAKVAESIQSWKDFCHLGNFVHVAPQHRKKWVGK
jgi:hypothetical protein